MLFNSDCDHIPLPMDHNQDEAADVNDVNHSELVTTPKAAHAHISRHTPFAPVKRVYENRQRPSIIHTIPRRDSGFDPAKAAFPIKHKSSTFAHSNTVTHNTHSPGLSQVVAPAAPIRPLVNTVNRTRRTRSPIGRLLHVMTPPPHIHTNSSVRRNNTRAPVNYSDLNFNYNPHF